MQSGDHHATPFVRATFADMAATRAAIDALQFASIESGAISISGPGAAEAERLAASRTGRSDAPIIWRVVWRGFWCSVAGAVIGAAAGVVFATSGLTLPGTSNSLVLQVVSWAMFLHV